jgi:hypothetical protein
MKTRATTITTPHTVDRSVLISLGGANGMRVVG